MIPATPQDAPPRHKNKVSPAKAAGFSILAAGSLSITVVAIVFTVSKWRQKRSLRVRYLRGVEMSTPSWVREPPTLSAVAKPERERHSGTQFFFKKKEGITVISFALVGSIYLFIFDNMLIAEGAEGKIDWPPKDMLRRQDHQYTHLSRTAARTLLCPIRMFREVQKVQLSNFLSHSLLLHPCSNTRTVSAIRI